MSTFLDTNVVSALLDPTHEFHGWSGEELIRCKANGPAIISDIVYCELCAGMRSHGELDAAIAYLDLERLSCSDQALFRAAQAFMEYRDRNQGPKLGVLPDFLIGAMAEVEGVPLITANSKDFVGYFPAIRCITPPNHARR